jgi:predicted CXXCH cytochrome family protein
MHLNRPSSPATIGRNALASLVVAATLLVGCSSEVRTRVMHFFFEYPADSDTIVTGQTDARGSLPSAPPGDEPPFPGESAARFASRHPPFVERQCQECHVRGSGQAPRPDFMNACRQCHQPLFAYQRFGHAPAVSADCRVCHFMHVSSNEALLKAPQATLCVSCHRAQHDEDASDTYHNEIDGLRCTACHDPHSADSQLLLRPEEVRQRARSAVDSVDVGSSESQTHP